MTSKFHILSHSLACFRTLFGTLLKVYKIYENIWKNAVCEGVTPFKCRCEVSVDGNSGMVVSRNFFMEIPPPQEKKKKKTENKKQSRKIWSWKLHNGRALMYLSRADEFERTAILIFIYDIGGFMNGEKYH